MEKQDLLYFALALGIVIVLGGVIKPMLTGETLQLLSFGRENGRTPPSVPPAPSPSQPNPAITVTPNVQATPATVQELPDPLKNIVSIDYPILPEDRPRPPDGGLRFPAVENKSPSQAVPVYKNNYSMRYSSAGLLIEAAAAPIVIDFEVTAKSNNTNDAFLLVTVRDYLTRDVIEESGYGRSYSTRMDKQIVLFHPGRYHLTLYGNLVDVRLKIYMGDISAIRRY